MMEEFPTEGYEEEEIDAEEIDLLTTNDYAVVDGVDEELDEEGKLKFKIDFNIVVIVITNSLYLSY